MSPTAWIILATVLVGVPNAVWMWRGWCHWREERRAARLVNRRKPWPEDHRLRRTIYGGILRRMRR